ncbi:transposase [Lachnospiraceae bacterium 42-17]|jgi:REP element-mobilizing transposase RayT|nr:hypothetical protein [Dorea sp.]
MPRRPRQKSATNCYHVVVRGLNKIAVFQDKREKTRILNLIRENYEKYNIKVYAYCIMSNHFHLLLEAELKELASFMAKIIASFAHYYNYKHNRTGYVFQGRFKSQCIENGSYFWSCLRYIHLNPVKAGMCKSIEDYVQSSVGEYNHPEKGKEKILSDAAYGMYEKRFQTSRDFMDFHKLSDRDFFIGMPEEELWQRKEIAKEVLKDMKYELKLPEEEILDYAKTRKKFEERLRERFNISQRYIKDIRKVIESELGQGK